VKPYNATACSAAITLCLDETGLFPSRNSGGFFFFKKSKLLDINRDITRKGKNIQDYKEVLLNQ